MKLIQVADEVRYPRMTTAELRNTFLVEDFFEPGRVQLAYVDLDRTIVGSAVPLGSALPLPCPELLRADSFTERREIGIFNIGGPGAVGVDGATHRLGKRDALYVGRGQHLIDFTSDDANAPAEFYLLSYPAHSGYPTALVLASDSPALALGATTTVNRRKITKLIHLESVKSCQLVMGFTELEEGSAWNTMPPHTHMRRSEVYLYFDLPDDHRVVHLMGPPKETRHLLVANKQVVISPGWSIHAGVGTSNYSFCWGMGGENQIYSDMDALEVAQLR